MIFSPMFSAIQYTNYFFPDQMYHLVVFSQNNMRTIVLDLTILKILRDTYLIPLMNNDIY